MNLIQKIKKIKEARELEKGLISDVIREIDNADITVKGVEKTSNEKCAIVSINAIRSHGMVLSPEFYIPDAQKRAMRDYLGKATNYENLIERILKCCEKKAIILSNKNKFLLNEESIRLLNSIYVKLSRLS